MPRPTPTKVLERLRQKQSYQLFDYHSCPLLLLKKVSNYKRSVPVKRVNGRGVRLMAHTFFD